MTFAQPEWLLLLFAIPAIALSSWLAWRRRGDKWKQLVADRLRSRLSHSRPGWTHFLGLGLALTGLASLIVALAQPESGEEWIEIESEGRNILFCIDISRSMLTTDVAPNRLMAARAAALEILEKFPNDRVGVLLFSGTVLVQSPLTIDHGFVEQTLAQLDPDDIPTGGSDLTNAIKEGTFLLANTGQRSNIMVIFSDGEKSSTGLEGAAASAAESGIFIYALGFGKDGGFIPDPRQRDGKFRDRNGRTVRSQLDEDSLRSIAERTDGFYSNGIGRDFLRKLDQALDEMDRFEESGKHQRVAKTAHKWFVLGGLLLLMSSLILRCFPTRVLVAGAAFLVMTPNAEASIFGHEGQKALDQGDYSKAHRSFDDEASKESGDRAAQLHLAAGSAAFQAKDWSPAATSFSQALATSNPALQQSAHYGLATSLFYLGAPLEGEEQIKAWQGAVKHYQHALEIDPNDTKSKDNLKTVQNYLQKKQEQQKQEEQQKEQEQKSDEEKKDEEQKDKDKSGEPPNKEEQDGDNSGDNQEQKDEEQKSKSKKPEEQKNPGDEGENKENQSGEKENEGQQGDEEKNDQEKKSGSGEQEPDEQPNPKQDDPGKGEQPEPSGEEKKGEEMSQQANGQQLPEPKNESPQERARRLLKQFSDFGAKPPRRVKTPFRRTAHDW